MANRFVSPQQQFISFAGQPYAGGFLYFYVSGTSTPTPTYQDEGLTTPNTNPVQLDSAGDAGNIFLDPGIVYKVELTDSNNNPIWTFDPVIPTDSNTASGFSPIVSCNAAGTNSITLTPITPSQQPALYSNYQVFAFVPVSTTTGPVSLQVGSLPSESVYVAPGVQAGAQTFLANDGPYYVAYGSLVAGSSPGFLLINSNIGSIQAKLPVAPPQGYLTLTSQTPVIATDVIAGTNVFLTPLFGLGCPVHNGVSIVSVLLPGELSLALTSSQIANNIYDIYIAFNGGTPVIGTGPSWAAGTSGSVTAGACVRGTGTGGSALVRTQGIWTNAAAMNLIYNLGAGNITLSVPANQGVYLGSIFIDNAAGQVSAYRSYGVTRKFGVWNAYNRQAIYLKAGDSNTGWNPSGTLGPVQGLAGNSLTVFTGLAEEIFDLKFFEKATITSGGTGVNVFLISAIGLNSTTLASGFSASGSQDIIGSVTGYTTGVSNAASLQLTPLLGINVITALESGSGASVSGGEANNVLTAQWRG